MPTVSVKWQKQVFPAVEIDTSQPPLVFKCQLYDLTGVPPERQKIMVKGGLLKDDADWSNLGIKEGQKLMMMGTADKVVEAPEEGPAFLEDLPEEKQVVAVGHSAGLFNLGNTCYMNSTLQCLHLVPELKAALQNYGSTRTDEMDQSTHTLTVVTRDLFNELDQKVNPVAPLQFLAGLKSELEKVSPLLGCSAIYSKESRINALPRYLTIQFVRFFWKRETKQKAKILRKVDYPLVLDVYDFCSDELRQKLQAPRQILRDSENAKLGLKAQDKNSGSKENDVSAPKSEESSGAEPSNTVSEADENVQLTGIFDLVAVLTHKGRSADSGHYVAWVKQESGKWIQYDDDNPILQREEDITRLSGGGDWHMAYICMYKARVVKV